MVIDDIRQAQLGGDKEHAMTSTTHQSTIDIAEPGREECCCSDFGEVFMLGDGEHLLFGQAAEPDAILKRDHVRPQSRTGGIIRGNLHEVIRFLPLNPSDVADYGLPTVVDVGPFD